MLPSLGCDQPLLHEINLLVFFFINELIVSSKRVLRQLSIAQVHDCLTFNENNTWCQRCNLTTNRSVRDLGVLCLYWLKLTQAASDEERAS